MKFLFLAAATLVSMTSAFSPIISSQQKQRTSRLLDSSSSSSRQILTEDPTYFEDLELAVHAVTKFGMLPPDALFKLADKVDAGSDTCIFEMDNNNDEEGKHSFLCEKEIADRKDVAEVLRMQAELKLRMDAIQGSSLFTADVLEEALIRERDMEMEILCEDGM